MADTARTQAGAKRRSSAFQRAPLFKRRDRRCHDTSTYRACLVAKAQGFIDGLPSTPAEYADGVARMIWGMYLAAVESSMPRGGFYFNDGAAERIYKLASALYDGIRSEAAGGGVEFHRVALLQARQEAFLESCQSDTQLRQFLDAIEAEALREGDAV